VPVRSITGDEQGLVGDGGDKDSREDMFASKGRRLYRQHGWSATIGTAMRATNFNTRSARCYQAISAMALEAADRAQPALHPRPPGGALRRREAGPVRGLALR
jgi:hypothetical protein